MEGTAEVKRRIECAEAELRVAKNELTRLQTPVEDIGAVNTKEYLNSIRCHSTQGKTINSRTDFLIEDGYSFGIPELADKLPFAYKASVVFSEYRHRLVLSVYKNPG